MATALRILRVVTRMNVGGPARHITMLMRGLAATRFDQRLVCGPCPENEGPGILGAELHAHVLGHLRRQVSPWHDWMALQELKRARREHNASILHSHTAKAGLLGRLSAKRAANCRAVHTFHGHTFERYFRGGSGRVLASVERFLAARSAALIVQSPSQLESVAAHLGPRAARILHLIPPAVQQEFLSEPTGDVVNIRSRLRIAEDCAVLLFPVRLAEVKQPLAALDVLQHLLRFRPVVLLVPGDGPLKTQFVETARSRGLDSSLRMLPFVNELWSLYDSSDACLLLSRSEGTPLVILESHARTLPVIATDVGAVHEMLHTADLLLPRECPAAEMAGQIHEFLNRRRLGDEAARASRARVAAEHSEELLCLRVAGLYESLA